MTKSKKQSKSRQKTRNSNSNNNKTTKSKHREAKSLQDRLRQIIDEANLQENPLVSIPDNLLSISFDNDQNDANSNENANGIANDANNHEDSKNKNGYNSNNCTSKTIQIKYLKSPLPPNILKQCLELFEVNMGRMYKESSWGLDMEEKRRELTHPDARFLVALSPPSSLEKDDNSERECGKYSCNNPSNENNDYNHGQLNSDNPLHNNHRQSRSSNNNSNKNNCNTSNNLINLSTAKLFGYTHHRHEYNIDDSPQTSTSIVTYLYELQISPILQRKCGLGQRLMNILELLSIQAKMSKIVLTVFKHNKGAMKFYLEKLKGWGVDEESPSNFGGYENNEGCDYEILSKVFVRN